MIEVPRSIFQFNSFRKYIITLTMAHSDNVRLHTCTLILVILHNIIINSSTNALLVITAVIILYISHIIAVVLSAQMCSRQFFRLFIISA